MQPELNHPSSVESDQQPADFPRTDSFTFSVALLIFVMVAQRGIGLVRNVLLCGLLNDEELGRWSLASNYLGWAAPFVVLGVPGSFGRLSEHFRRQGQLGRFLRQAALLSLSLMVIAAAAHVFAPSWFAKLVYNNQQQVTTIPILGLVLGIVITLNFLIEYLTSVRCNRVVSRVYLVQSLGFAVLSVLLLTVTHLREEGVLIAFGLSSAIAAMIGLRYVMHQWRELPPLREPVASSAIWSRVANLAVWIWIGNSVANLLDCTDQFLLKHYIDLPPETVDAMIGQLYASRVLPVLIVSVAVLTGGCLLPYLIKDWEAGNRHLAEQRMNNVVKFCAIGFTLIAAVTHIASPLLFGWLLRGKYTHGLELMPWGFVQYSWFGLTAIANKYLICVDKPRIGIIPLALGLVSAALLIALLAPVWGLQGVVIATMSANGIAFLSLLWMTSVCGMKWDARALLASVVPLTLCLGGWASLGIIAALLVGGWQSQWLITIAERQQFQDAIADYFQKFRNRLRPQVAST